MRRLWRNRTRSRRVFLPAGIALNEETIGREIVNVLNPLQERPATIYDRIVDSLYNASHIGGGFHRLVDGAHDLLHMAEKVRAASPADTVLQEIAGYVTAVWKDLATARGLPLISLSKSTFDRLVSLAQGLGLSREYVYDVLTTNLAEVLAAVLTLLGLTSATAHDDPAKATEKIGKLAGIHMVAANPIGLAASAGLLLRVLRREGRRKRVFSHLLRGSVKGSLLQGSVRALAARWGPGWTVGFLLAVVLLWENRRRLIRSRYGRLAADLLREAFLDAACSLRPVPIGLPRS